MTSNNTRASNASTVRQSMLRLILCLGLAFTLTTGAYAWSNPGHMAVALVAYRRLTPQTRARVDQLVAMNPKIEEWRAVLPSNASAARKREILFMIAATWADQIKDDGEHDAPDGLNGDANKPPDDGTGDDNIGYSDDRKRKYWHFKDLPIKGDNTPVEDPPEINAESQMKLFRQVLASNESDELKSYDLVWLMHLVGDLHQPLHCVSRFTHAHDDGDAGGNFVMVCDGNSCGRTLHSFWDGLFGSTLVLMPGVNRATSLVGTLPSVPASQANNLNVSEWIEKGRGLARAFVYQDPIDHGNVIKNPSTYRNNAISVGVKQIALAGARLAKILNEELR